MRIPLVVISFVERGVPEVIDGQVSEGQVPEYSINPRSPIVQSVDMPNHSLIEHMLGEEKVREIWDCVHQHTNCAVSEGIDSSADDVCPNLSAMLGMDGTESFLSPDCCGDATGAEGWGLGMPCAAANGFEPDFNGCYR